MHIWTELIGRESLLLIVLLALGAGPASLLSDRFDTAGRLALAPVLGFCAGTCITTTVLEFAPAGRTYWLLIPLVALSLGIAGRRTLYASNHTEWRTRLPMRDLAQLLVVCLAVAGPLTYTLHEHHTVGPATYYYTDVDNYVAEQDGAITTSITSASSAWEHSGDTVSRFADLTQLDWAFFSSFNANPNATPLAANVAAFANLGATDTNSSFLIIVLLTGSLGVFAAIRYITKSRTWIAALGGALFGGPFFLELWFDTFQAAVIALGLLSPLVILGCETVRLRRHVDLLLLGLVLACFLIVYPVLFPILIISGIGALLWYARGLRSDGRPLKPLLVFALTATATLTVLLIVFDNLDLLHAAHYYHEILDNMVPLPRVSWHLPLDVLPGWLLQTREFWNMPSLGVGGSKQVMLGALLPVIFIAFIVVGIRRYRPAAALLILACVCMLVAEYSYASRSACTYCAERDLLPIGPIAAVLLALGLAAVLAMPQRWVRILGVAGAAVVVIAVGQRARVELTRFTEGSYFLDSANRSVLSKLPRKLTALQVEGYGQTLSAQAEQPLVYELANEHVHSAASIALGSNLDNGIQYLDFGTVESPGSAFRPDYDYVLTRFAAIHTDRRTVARSGGIALEQRTHTLDVMSYAGLGAPLERLDTSGTAWVQSAQPLQFYVTGTTEGRAWARVTFRTSVPVQVASQAGIKSRLQGNTLTVCAPATGPPPTRDVSMQLITPALAPGPIPSGEFPPPTPPESIALTAMRALSGRCIP